MNGKDQFPLTEMIAAILHNIITDPTRVMLLLTLVW